MIRVRVFCGPNSQISGFEMEGHAGYSDYGKDIVCAAVSAVSQTAVVGLLHFISSGVESVQQEGRLSCRFSRTLTPDENTAAQIIFKTMYYGLQSINTEYKGYMDIVVEGGEINA